MSFNLLLMRGVATNKGQVSCLYIKETPFVGWYITHTFQNTVCQSAIYQSTLTKTEVTHHNILEFRIEMIYSLFRMYRKVTHMNTHTTVGGVHAIGKI